MITTKEPWEESYDDDLPPEPPAEDIGDEIATHAGVIIAMIRKFQYTYQGVALPQDMIELLNSINDAAHKIQTLLGWEEVL